VIRLIPDSSELCKSTLVHNHQITTLGKGSNMTRLTITLSESRHRALKETAAVRGKTIGQLIDKSLDFYGVKSHGDAAELVRRARTANALSQQQAIDLALDEVKQSRRLQ
jgi:hypothetical protein